MKRLMFSKVSPKSSLKQISIEAIYSLILMAGILSKLIYFQYSSGLSKGKLLDIADSYMMSASFFIILIFFSLVGVIFNRKRNLALFILDIFLTIILVADTLYFRYYRNPLTIPVLMQIGLVGSLGESITALFKSKDIIFAADIPLLLVLLFYLKRNSHTSIHLLKRLAIGTLVIAASIYGLYHDYNNVNVLMFEYDKNYVAKDLGVFYFHAYDINSFTKQSFLSHKALTNDDKELIKEYFDNKPKSAEQYKGIARGKNLIVIQLEAIQEYLINRSLYNKEITPNLNKLIKESAYFDNFYYQVGAGNTADAEFLSNNSLHPAKEGTVYFRFPLNTYQSLPKILKGKGYDTYAFHAYNPSFWNRTTMYKTLGFDVFYSNKDFVLDEIKGWGLGDASFLKQSLNKIDTSNPFYGFFITLSSHYAYGAFESNHDFFVGKYAGTTLGNYFKAAHYVDKAIGSFINELKQKGLYDNTILVIYGDHHSFPRDKADELLEFLNIDNSEFEWIKYQKVPLIIHYPGLKNGRIITTAGGEIDILPTLANLLGVDAPYAMGKDLLNTQNGFAVLRNGSYVTDNYIYISSLDKAYDINSGKQLDLKDYKEDLNKFRKELDVSDIILEKDALKALDR